jgi:adenine phosphoribosyltransferase
MELKDKIKSAIRDVPDFPKEGINFKDITTIFKNPVLSKEMLNHMVEKYKDLPIDAVAGIESRGFLLGPALAMELNVPFVLIRKKGKLPYHTVTHKYDLEYGTAEIEMHTDAVEPGQKVLIHDDLLATGGSAQAAATLVTKQGGKIAGFDFIIELNFLEGREVLKEYSENISTLVAY